MSFYPIFLCVSNEKHRVSEAHEMGASEKTNCLDVKKNKNDWRKIL